MAWLAVNKDGSEWIFANKPTLDRSGYWEDSVFESWDGQGGRPVHHHYSDIELPKGTIEKILGHYISHNEPVEIS